MRKLILFIATSLDGYIARKNDELDWLYEAEPLGEGDMGYSEFYETIDTIIMGRRTFDEILRIEQGDIPYKGKKIFVFSKTQKKTYDRVSFINENTDEFIRQLKKEMGKNIWVVGGGDFVHQLLKEGLIDEMIITVAPRLIGNGIPLFVKDSPDLKLNLIETKAYNQFVYLHYKIEREK